MFSPPHYILPAPESGWEVWSNRGGSYVRGGWFEDAAAAAASVKKAVLALPARWCRTLAFQIPPADAKLSRALGFTQLEKRGLATGSIDQTSFSCQPVAAADGSKLLITDVLTPSALTALAALKTHGVVPSARLYPLPDQRISILREGGRTVLHAGIGGRVAHVQLLTASPSDIRALASEISLVLMTLRQQNLLSRPAGIDWSAPLPAEDREFLESHLGIPLEIKSRPDPIHQPLDPALQPAPVRAARSRRRLQVVRAAALAALPLVGLLWGFRQHRNLLNLETQAIRLEQAVAATSGANAEARAGMEKMRGTQQRWQSLRMALEPKRYPLIQLNHLTRCLGGEGIVLTRFETRGPDVSVSGTAQSAGEAYQYFTTVTADADLRICAWSMAEPSLKNDGTAQFELKGKMR